MIADGNNVRGSTPPLVFSMEPISGFSLKDLEFTLEVFSESGIGKTQTIPKSNTFPIDDNNVRYYVDTALIGTGKYYTRAHISIPDAQAPNGVWKEVKTIESGITINAR